FFFFQAEDGIRDYKVTGVQTCALPISRDGERRSVKSPTSSTLASRPWGTSPICARHRGPATREGLPISPLEPPRAAACRRPTSRSEERRVGKRVDVAGGGTRNRKEKEQ